MINLKIIINLFIYFYIFFGIIFINIGNLLSSENKIIFKINDKAFTTVDYEQRLQYLDFVGNNKDLDKDTIINDFISANLFFEFYKSNNNKNDYAIKINEIFENILNTNTINNKKNGYQINKDNIIKNIKIDYIRKIVLENIINSNKKNFRISQEDIDLLYNIKVKYINFKTNNFDNLMDEINSFNNFNFEVIKEFLSINNIDFFTKEKEINNINSIDKRIKDNILLNNKFFIIENKNLISLVFIEKNFETFEGINANLYSVRSENELESSYLNCANLSKINNPNIQKKEYKMIDLNNDLKQNLININDYVKYISNNKNVYIVLCDINFDLEMLNNVNSNKLINLKINEIESKFINKYSKIYNLIQFNE